MHVIAGKRTESHAQIAADCQTIEREPAGGIDADYQVVLGGIATDRKRSIIRVGNPHLESRVGGEGNL